MKKYKISEFSKLMGVSLKTLKHYEKFNILLPDVDEESNYRYYNFYHGGKMLRSRCFTNLGFTVNETSQLMSNMRNDKIIDALDNQEAISARELELSILRLERLKQIKQRYMLFNERANTWLIKNRKDLKFVSRFVMPILAIISAVFFVFTATGLFSFVLTKNTNGILNFLVFGGIVLISAIFGVLFFKEKEDLVSVVSHE